MWQRHWQNWLQLGPQTERRRRAAFRPYLEALERRVMPATFIWSGNSINNDFWSAGANWQGGIAPGAGDDLVFPAGAARLSATNDFSNGGPAVFNSIKFDTGSGGYTLDGNPVMLMAGITNNTTNASQNIVAFNGMVLGASQAFTAGAAGGSLIVTSDVNLGSNNLMLDGLTSANAINGIINGNGAITKQGNALWVFGGSNKYVGVTTINAGALALNNESGLGDPSGRTIVNPGGSLVPNSIQGSTVTISEPLTLNGAGGTFPGAVAIDSQGGRVILAGPVTLGSATTFGSNVPSATPLTIQSDLATGGFNFTSSGTLSLSIGGRVSGGGTLISNAALIGGVGQIGTPLQVGQGTLFPGANGAPGLLTVAAVTFNQGTSFQVILNGAGAGAFSQLQVNGTTNLTGSALNASLNFNALGKSFVLINSTDPINGTFNGLPNGARLTLNGQNFIIQYLTPSNLNQLEVSSQVLLINTDTQNAQAPIMFVPIPPGQQTFVTGADAGGGPDVKVFLAMSSQPLFSFFAYNPNFTGGVRVAVGDVNGDTVSDIITAAGPGGGPNITVLNGADGTLMFNFFAYSPNFTGGVFVAAGDVNGDGKADIICGADGGGGPNITVFSGLDASRLATFFAYNSGFTGGVRVAGGDINGDGKAEIIAGAGPGGGPNITIFDVAGTMLRTFFAFPAGFTAGIYVSSGDVTGDKKAEVIAGAGPGGGPNVSVYDVSAVQQVLLLTFFPYDPAFNGGVRVAAIHRDGDGKADVLTVPGPGGGPDLGTFNGVTGARLDQFFAYNPGFTGGLYLAATGK